MFFSAVTSVAHVSPLPGYLRFWGRCFCAWAGPLWGCAISAGAAEAGEWADLEQLGQVQVITATKQLQQAWTTPAALTVISHDDLRFSGVSSLPQALRLAPGADVGQINAQRYSVGIRGWAGEFSNKLLVLQDGRSLFNPQFLGVFWDAQDTLLDDVDRIEVVRGPGGTAWGVNAVNGVVNVLTKDAIDTQGAMVRAGGGSLEEAFASVRYGGRVGEATHYRVYAKAFSRGETESAAVAGLRDDWKQSRAGFRVDSQPSADRHLTVQGEAYTGRLLQYSSRVPDEFLSSGAHALARWDARLANGASLGVVSYFDSVRRSSAPATANSETFSFEANHRFSPAASHRLSSSFSYTRTRNEAFGRIGHNYDPAVRTIQPFSVAVTDEYQALPDRLALATGFKAERNHFTGWEVLPSARLTWTPSEQATGWLAVSRGLQTPSISEYDLTIDVPGVPRVMSLPDRRRAPAEVVAYEAGWRQALTKTLTLDGALFFSVYDRLPAPQTTFDAAASLLKVEQTILGFGKTYGGELAAVWQPAPWWRWRASYSLLRMDLGVRPGSNDTAGPVREEGLSPKAHWQLMSVAHLGRTLNLTAWLRYVGDRPSITIPGYLGLDVRLAYQLSPEFEVVLTGKDLLDERHPEYSRSVGFPTRSEIPRSVMLEMVWRR